MSDLVEVSTDPARLDVEFVHRFLAGSYWAQGIPRPLVEKSIRGSLCFGAFAGDRQIGFARVISDYATFAYVADVFVSESHRGRGVATQLMGAIMAHPRLQGLRRWHLVTRDAHGLYRRFGFSAPAAAEWHMEIIKPDSYLSAEGES